MFNVWLPTVLEMKQKEGTDKIKGSLNDVVLYALAGCPGSAVSCSDRVPQLTPRSART